MKQLKNNSLATISIDNKYIPTGVHEFSKFNLTEESFNELVQKFPGVQVLLDKRVLEIISVKPSEDIKPVESLDSSSDKKEDSVVGDTTTDLNSSTDVEVISEEEAIIEEKAEVVATPKPNNNNKKKKNK